MSDPKMATQEGNFEDAMEWERRFEPRCMYQRFADTPKGPPGPCRNRGRWLNPRTWPPTNQWLWCDEHKHSDDELAEVEHD